MLNVIDCVAIVFTYSLANVKLVADRMAFTPEVTPMPLNDRR